MTHRLPYGCLLMKYLSSAPENWPLFRPMADRFKIQSALDSKVRQLTAQSRGLAQMDAQSLGCSALSAFFSA